MQRLLRIDNSSRYEFEAKTERRTEIKKGGLNSSLALRRRQARDCLSVQTVGHDRRSI